MPGLLRSPSPASQLPQAPRKIREVCSTCGSNCLAQIPKGGAIPVGAALCRERAARQPQQFQLSRINPGAALRPFRDTRPLPQVQRQPRDQRYTRGSWLAGEEARTGCMRFAYQPRNSLYAGLSVSSQYRYPISSSANGNPANSSPGTSSAANTRASAAPWLR
ncbi:hypothetical protein D3C72_724200 [compost metagenome]